MIAGGLKLADFMDTLKSSVAQSAPHLAGLLEDATDAVVVDAPECGFLGEQARHGQSSAPSASNRSVCCATVPDGLPKMKSAMKFLA